MELGGSQDLWHWGEMVWSVWPENRALSREFSVRCGGLLRGAAVRARLWLGASPAGTKSRRPFRGTTSLCPVGRKLLEADTELWRLDPLQVSIPLFQPDPCHYWCICASSSCRSPGGSGPGYVGAVPTLYQGWQSFFSLPTCKDSKPSLQVHNVHLLYFYFLMLYLVLFEVVNYREMCTLTRCPGELFLQSAWPLMVLAVGCLGNHPIYATPCPVPTVRAYTSLWPLWYTEQNFESQGCFIFYHVHLLSPASWMLIYAVFVSLLLIQRPFIGFH